MKFNVLFWNIWLNNQINGPANSSKLLDELQRITAEYQPDCIGLNEVLQQSSASLPFVTDYLKTLGYAFTYFAPASPLTNEWLIGAAVSSRLPLTSTNIIVLGQDTFADIRGYPSHTVDAISTEIRFKDDRVVNFIVAHPIAIKWPTIKEHFRHTTALTKIIHSPRYLTNTILGGDLNEPLHLPGSFTKTNRATLNHRSGSFRNPTWRHNASPITPIRANLDQLFWTKKGILELGSFKVISSNISDHRPLFAEFSVLWLDGF